MTRAPQGASRTSSACSWAPWPRSRAPRRPRSSPRAPHEREGQQEVVDDLAARERERDLASPAVRARDREARAALGVEGHVRGAHGVRPALAHAHHVHAGRAAEPLLYEGGVVARARERESGVHAIVRDEARDHLGLGARDVLAAAEKPDVARAHVGDAGERGAAGRGHAPYLAGVVHAELAHENLRVLGSREDRERQADEAVEVARGWRDSGASRPRRRRASPWWWSCPQNPSPRARATRDGRRACVGRGAGGTPRCRRRRRAAPRSPPPRAASSASAGTSAEATTAPAPARAACAR